MRDYRLLESTDTSGRTTLREEQLEAEATFRIARGEISGTTRIPHSRGGGGFDHVFVEFVGSGPTTQARIRIIEVKDYPGRSVPLEEFTAIQGDGLRENLGILQRDRLPVHESADEPLVSARAPRLCTVSAAS